MKNSLLIFLLSFILLHPKLYAAYEPEILPFTPSDGSIIMISEAETGTYVDIDYRVEQLGSSNWNANKPYWDPEWCGFEIWIYVDGYNVYYYRDPPRDITGEALDLVWDSILHQWLSVGTHSITIKAKNFVIEGFIIQWLQTYEVQKTQYITIKHPFTVNISRAFEFDQTESLPSQHSASGDPIQISVVPTYNHPSGRQYAFGGWSDGNTTNPRAVTDNSTISALYKMNHKSNDALAFSNNSQRRLIQTKAGNNPRWLHQVYTSSIGGVFLMYG